MNGKVWNTRVTRKIEANIYRTIIEAVVNSVMCCLVRIYERARNWEFAFRRNGILETISKEYQGKTNLQIMKLDKIVFTDSKYTGATKEL